MRPAALLLLCALGCRAEVGLVLEVAPPPGLSLDRFEVFVATGDCTDLPADLPCARGVGWAPGVRPPGEVYLMRLDAQEVVQSRERRADRLVLRLQAGPDFATPRKFAIVGFDGSGAAVAAATLAGAEVEIPSDVERTWRVQLEPADMARADVIRPPDLAAGEATLRVHTWTREREPDPATLSRCLAVQAWDEPARRWDGYFVVPEDDPDCDGFYAPAIECDPLAANFAFDGTCVAEVTQPTGDAPVCVVGTGRCKDGVSDDLTCAPLALPPSMLRTCVPGDLCRECLSIVGAGACVVDAILRRSTARLECKLARDATTMGLCPEPVLLAQLPGTCTGVAVTPLGQGLPGNLTFATQVTLQLGGATVAIFATTSSPPTTPPMCNIGLDWTSGALAAQQAWFTLFVRGETGAAAIPLLLDVQDQIGACFATDGPICQRNNLDGDAVLSCLSAAL